MKEEDLKAYDNARVTDLFSIRVKVEKELHIQAIEMDGQYRTRVYDDGTLVHEARYDDKERAREGAMDWILEHYTVISGG